MQPNSVCWCVRVHTTQPRWATASLFVFLMAPLENAAEKHRPCHSRSDAALQTSKLGARVAGLGGLWRVAFWGQDFDEIKLFLSHCCTCHKESLLGYPPPHSRTIPSLRPPAWALLGNQNQLLVLSPLSLFWRGINCRVVFSESSL